MPVVLFIGGPYSKKLKRFPSVPPSFSVKLDEPELDAQGLPITQVTYHQHGRLGRIGLYLVDGLGLDEALEKIAIEWADL